MRSVLLRRLKGLWSRFHADQSGIALIYITVALPVIIGFSLLAIDVGRLYTLQSTLQHGTDALALAGAGELDRRPDAITRANNAINTLITTNSSLFATSVVTINGSDIATPCYLSALPASDATSVPSAGYLCLPVDTSAHIASSSQIARYVKVSVNPANFNTIFPVNFLGVGTTTETATAVAGFDAAVCNFTPLFMCNPLEPANNSDMNNDFGLSAMANSYTTRRSIIRFLAFSGGNNVTTVPGQFGFLNVSGGGANALGDEIASIVPQECYILNTLSTKTGSMNTLIKAFNLRFDDYPPGNGSYSPSTTYPPGINVRKGYVTPTTGNANNRACNAAAGTTTTNPNNSNVMALPVDSCFATNTCATVPGGSGNANIGNGDWGWNSDLSTTTTATAFRTASGKIGYWDLNFIGTTNNTAVLPTSPDGNPYSNANQPSRYDLYRYEISSGIYNRYSVTGSTGSGGAAQETGLPKCAASQNTPVSGVDTTTGSVDRRIIYGAVVNCTANNLQPGSNGIYHALAFAKFFMVRPVDSNNTLWTELVSLVYPGDGTGVARDRVQLYR